MKAFDVYLIQGADKQLVDRVFFQGMPAPAVKRSLVEHDGYPPNIYVQRTPRRSLH